MQWIEMQKTTSKGLYPQSEKGSLFSRCLMVLTDQADPSCFYFKISWILMEWHGFYFSLSPSFSAGLQKPRTLTASRIKYEKFWLKM